MKNLDQIRAQHALDQVNKKEIMKAYADRVPSMIVNNGLLATAAFAATDNQKERIGPVISAVCSHLRQLKLSNAEDDSPRSLCKDLADKSSEHLRVATDEALAYLSYLKRFAKKPKSGGD